VPCQMATCARAGCSKQSSGTSAFCSLDCMEEPATDSSSMSFASNDEHDVNIKWYINHAVGVGLRGICSVDRASRGCAPQKNRSHEFANAGGTYDWIRKDNFSMDRSARRDISAITQRVLDCRGYVISGSCTVALQRVSDCIAGTRLLSPSLGDFGDWPRAETVDEGKGATFKPRPEWSRQVTALTVVKDVVLGVAVQRSRAGKRVVAVQAASAYHLGGGFLSGGRHALEEAFCVQSTLFASLERAEELSDKAGVHDPDWISPKTKRDGSPWHRHLPDDGAALSPHVEVFRRGTNDGYLLEDAATILEAVVSVAMPNCNRDMNDSPVDAHPDQAEYTRQLEQKWRVTLAAAAFYTEADCLVVPDAGCGVFGNPPEEVGAALGRVLQKEFRGRFAEVVVAFPGGGAGEAFFAAAEATFAGKELVKKAVWECSVGAPAAAKVTGPVCRKGCGRVPFGRFPTCCTHCHGPDGPHAHDCDERAGTGAGKRPGKPCWEQFDSECQDDVEANYKAFKDKVGADVVTIQSCGSTIVVNFAAMSSYLKKSPHESHEVRRLERVVFV